MGACLLWIVASTLQIVTSLTDAPSISLRGVRRFYDVVGGALDLLAPFEDGARRRALELGDVAARQRVVELGCGTGRTAAELLGAAPETLRYTGLDASSTMAALATRRLAPFSARARVEEGDFLAKPIEQADAVLAFYVLDLLSAADADRAIAAARAALRGGGAFCAASIAFADDALPSRVLMRSWGAVSSKAPLLLGGCRPVALIDRFRDDPAWRVVAAERVSVLGYASEVVVATPA